MLDATEIEALFTRSDERYVFARWGRAISPVVFGVTDETLQVVKGAIEAVCLVSNHHMAETDPELGSNAMFFFFNEQFTDLTAGVIKLLDKKISKKKMHDS